MRKEYKVSKIPKRGQEYTLSVYLTNDSHEVEAYLGLNYYIGRTKDQEITFTVNEVITDNTLIIDTGSAGDIIDRVKLEKGSKATDWTSAPEDDKEYIDSQIIIESDRISSILRNDTDTKISKVTQTIDEFKVDVRDDVRGIRSSIKVNADEISTKVSGKDFNGYNISSMITQTPSAISLMSRNIDLSGRVTFSSFSTGTRNTLNQTATNANNALSGVAEAKQEAYDAYWKARQAEIDAESAFNKAERADGWRYQNTTEIDGGKIRTKTITANTIRSAGTLSGVHISGGTINVGSGSFRVFSNGSISGANGNFEVAHDGDGVYNSYAPTNSSATGDNTWGARWKRNNSHYIYQDTSSIAFYQSGQSFRFQDRAIRSAKNGQFDIYSTGENISLRPGNSRVYIDGSLRAYDKKVTMNMGDDGYRWNNIYARMVDESSDMRLKEDIKNIPPNLVSHFKDVKPKIYKMDGRKQFGYIAQDVERALFKYTMEEYGIETARNNKEIFNIVGQDESYLSLVYRQVSMIKDAEKDSEIKELKQRLLILEEKMGAIK